MKRLKLSILSSLLLLAGWFNIAEAQNLGVHPTILEYKLAPGQTEAQVIHMTNGSGKKLQFRLYLNDWMRDSLGGHMYFRPDTLPQSASSWVTVDKNFIELEPGQNADIVVRLTLPNDVSLSEEMKWSMLFIESVEEQTQQDVEGAQVRNLLRLGIHIYQTPPTLTEKQVKVIDITRSREEENTWLLLCQNSGKIMVECNAYLELAALSDGKKTRIDVNEFPMFPGQRRYVSFKLPPDLPKGKYSALGVLDAGEDVSLEAVETTIEIR